MKQLLNLTFIIFLLSIGSRCIALQNDFAGENILYVGGTGENNYTDLQEAINAAMPGDKIIVVSGIYGKITVNKSVSIEGKGAVTGEITIVADNVSITGLIIKDSFHAIVTEGNSTEIRNCSIVNNSYGIKAEGAYNKIHLNKIFKNWGYGIKLASSERNEIKENEICRNKWGIWLGKSHENVISSNIIRNNHEGIVIMGGKNNIIKRNHIADNTNEGIYFCCQGENNLVFENNFVGNTLNALCYGEVNHWNFGNIGNYWDDYDGKGIYEIGEGNIDYHPSLVPYDIIQTSYRIYILYPSEKEKVCGKIVVKGVAEKEGKVEVKIDEGAWQGANGIFLWHFELNTRKLENGEHIIYARCEDEVTTLKIYVENNKNIPSFEFVLLVIAIFLTKKLR